MRFACSPLATLSPFHALSIQPQELCEWRVIERSERMLGADPMTLLTSGACQPADAFRAPADAITSGRNAEIRGRRVYSGREGTLQDVEELNYSSRVSTTALSLCSSALLVVLKHPCSSSLGMPQTDSSTLEGGSSFFCYTPSSCLQTKRANCAGRRSAYSSGTARVGGVVCYRTVRSVIVSYMFCYGARCI